MHGAKLHHTSGFTFYFFSCDHKNIAGSERNELIQQSKGLDNGINQRVQFEGFRMFGHIIAGLRWNTAFNAPPVFFAAQQEEIAEINPQLDPFTEKPAEWGRACDLKTAFFKFALSRLASRRLTLRRSMVDKSIMLRSLPLRSREVWRIPAISTRRLYCGDLFGVLLKGSGR